MDKTSRTDPYASLSDLANGWRAQADDLVLRADQQTDRAESLARVPQRYRGRLDPDPEQLLQSARANKVTAATFMTAARNLDESIDFARRHVLSAYLRGLADELDMPHLDGAAATLLQHAHDAERSS